MFDNPTNITDINTESMKEYVSYAEEDRAKALIKRIFNSSFTRLFREFDAGKFGSWHYSKLRDHFEHVLTYSVNKHCNKVLTAAKCKPAVYKLMEELEQKKKDTRKELSTGLKNTRAKFKALQAKEISLQTKCDLVEAYVADLNGRVFNMENYAQADTIGNAVFYPSIPTPIIECSIDGNEIPEYSGIYFLWADGAIAYVGKSVNLKSRLRLGTHHRIDKGDWISYLPFDRDVLNWAECHYIGRARPLRNFGTRAYHNGFNKKVD